jgi:putative colanic acid biosynthesis UDP-glucose lipid carrier transferase
LSGRRAAIKAIEDAVLGTALVVISMPLMLACAIAVKLDGPGPVLFRQDRYGFNNQRITVLKFRSMTAGRPAEPGVPQAKRDDPRITRVGRWLRRTSLDELPQLFNVLAGTMSLVGPRPHAVEHNDMYAKLIAGYSGRHRVKPGITGWAQINGLRGETDTLDKMEQRVRYDIEYVERWSLGLDLRILLVTAMIAWRQPTAY